MSGMNPITEAYHTIEGREALVQTVADAMKNARCVSPSESVVPARVERAMAEAVVTALVGPAPMSVREAEERDKR